LSRLLEDIARAQKARKKADQDAAALQSIPLEVKADSSVSVAPVAGNAPPLTAQPPVDTSSSVERFIELEQAAGRRILRDADALEEVKRREEETARRSEASKSWLKVEAQQLELAQTLEAEHAKAALAAEAATQLEEQARQVAEKRLAAQARATDAAQRLQQSEERRAQATRARLEAEKTLAVAEVAHVLVEHKVDEIHERQRTDNAERNDLRGGRYRRLAANIGRGASGGLVVFAFALGVGVTALVGIWRSPSPTLANHPLAQTDKSVRQDRPTLKMDRDLDAFAARASKSSPKLQKQ
jgi:hypothetical protein